MMENRSINEEYSQIAHDLIENEPILNDIKESEVTILYLSSDYEKKSKGKIVCGECEKIPDKYKWSIPADFTITIYEPNVIGFTDEQMKILLLHELLHVGIKFTDNGDESYFIRPHDIEDFRQIIDKYGLDWDLPEWSEVSDYGE
jgi:hypothetical protein